MSAAFILAIPMDEPERLFKNKNHLRQEYLILLKTWHPDINKDPLAAKVAAHIQALYEKAQEKLTAKIWNPPGLLQLTGRDGRVRTIKYRVKRSFELGEMYVGDTIVTFAIKRCFENLAIAGLRAIGTIRYPNETFRKSLEQYVPKVEHFFETGDYILVCCRKRKDEILLSDLIEHLGGKIDPKHVAWIMSCLFNLASFLQITDLTVNGITPQTVFVSTPTHSLSILGGWWYGAEKGKPLASLPPDVYKLAPRKLLISKQATPSLDLECMRACGRAALGDVTGNSFRMRNDIPKPMAEFLQLPSGSDAVKEYDSWMKVLEDSFGPRKFVKLEVTSDMVYPLEAA